MVAENRAGEDNLYMIKGEAGTPPLHHRKGVVVVDTKLAAGARRSGQESRP
jgi:hypothetical protein